MLAFMAMMHFNFKHQIFCVCAHVSVKINV